MVEASGVIVINPTTTFLATKHISTPPSHMEHYHDLNAPASTGHQDPTDAISSMVVDDVAINGSCQPDPPDFTAANFGSRDDRGQAHCGKFQDKEMAAKVANSDQVKQDSSAKAITQTTHLDQSGVQGNLEELPLSAEQKTQTNNAPETSSPVHMDSGTKAHGEQLFQVLQMFKQATSSPLSGSILRTPTHKTIVNDTKRIVSADSCDKQRKSPRISAKSSNGKSALRLAQYLIAKKCGIIQNEDSLEDQTLQQYLDMYKKPLPDSSVQAILKLSEVASESKKKKKSKKEGKKEGSKVQKSKEKENAPPQEANFQGLPEAQGESTQGALA
jgi:hypothetical protein